MQRFARLSLAFLKVAYRVLVRRFTTLNRGTMMYPSMRFDSRLVWLVAFLSLRLVFGASAAAQESLDELLKEGAAFSRQADYGRAIACLEKAKELDPRNYEVSLLLGVGLLRSGRPMDAIEPLRLAAEINPGDGVPAAYLGDAFVAVSDFALAAETYQDAMARSPKSEIIWTKWADFDLERFRFLDLQLRTTQRGMATVLRVQAKGLGSGTQDREDLLQRSALADPEQSGIWGELGAEQLQRGLREQASASLKAAQDHQPQNLWTLRLGARVAVTHGDWQEAENRLLSVGSRSLTVLRKELRAWPPELAPGADVPGEIWNCVRQASTACLARIAFREHNALSVDELFAEERWEELAAAPRPRWEDTRAWFQRGVAQAELADCSDAIPSLERGLDSGAERAAFGLELCYVTEAERTANHLTALGDRGTVHRLRGDMLVRIKGDPKSATSEYIEAIRLKPREPVLLERLAQAYVNSGDMQQARLAAQKALLMDPKRPLSLRLLASIDMNERDYAGALVVLEKMLALNPNNAWTRVQAAMAYAQTGKPETAIRYLQPALEAGYPDERGALHATLAGVLRKLGREQEAQRATEEAERLANHFQRGVPNLYDDHQ